MLHLLAAMVAQEGGELKIGKWAQSEAALNPHQVIITHTDMDSGDLHVTVREPRNQE